VVLPLSTGIGFEVSSDCSSVEFRVLEASRDREWLKGSAALVLHQYVWILGAESSDQYLKTFQQEISTALTIIVQTSSDLVLNTRWAASPCL
jgi:hypothetical protein